MAPADTQRLGEFALIAELFAPLSENQPGAYGLQDDAASLSVPPGQELVLTKDMIVEGIHFRSEDTGSQVARKLLRVNLSDLAAKGAKPAGYLLACALPVSLSMDWLRDFAAGLAQDQNAFDISLLGGDTTATPGPATFSLTAVGTVPTGQMLHRFTAKDGDDIWVSGTIGDGGLGLRALRGEVTDMDGFLAGRYLLPQPHMSLGLALRGHVSACMDISDGLVADLEHICETSGLAAEIDGPAVPLSPAARSVLDVGKTDLVALVSSGDDYELLFTASRNSRNTLKKIEKNTGISLSRVGRMVAGQGVKLLDAEGQTIHVERPGYRHF